jgi:CrcB protein
MLNLAAIFVGGGAGSVARYLTMVGCGRLCGTEFPWGAVVVNVVGSFIMGVLVELFARVWSAGEAMRVLLTVGFLGGYTTFSTFSLDVALLVERGATVAAAGLHRALGAPLDRRDLRRPLPLPLGAELR